MNWLLWKEYRQNRVIVLVMLLLLAVPYVIWLWATCATWQDQYLLDDPTASLAIASLYSLGLSQLVLALIGGNAIAGERADRSAEFQVYLPLTRRQTLSAKLLLALALVATIWLVNLPAPWILLRNVDSSTMYRWFGTTETYWQILSGISFTIATVGATFFCVAWFFSSILTSPSASVVAGLVAPLLVFWIVSATTHLLQAPQPEVLALWFFGICLTLSPLCFAAGTWLYLRRVEP